MRTFFTKSAIFMLFPVLYFGINMLINHYLFTHQEVKMEIKQVMIAGDSHAMINIDPNYFYSAQNIAQTAEPFVLTFWKLKKVFKSVVPDTLILSVSPHNITAFNDRKFFDEDYSAEMFRRCYPIEEFDLVSKYVQVDYMAYYKVLWKHTAFFPKTNHISYIGRFISSPGNNFSKCDSTIKRHFYQEGTVARVSTLALHYLDSITQLCAAKKVELIITGPPLHQNYLSHIPAGIMNTYLALMESYGQQHFVYNRTNTVYPDSLYLNCDHLNNYGATRFTQEFLQALQARRDTLK